MARALSPLIIVFAAFSISCNKTIDQSMIVSENILAKVGDKTITVNDYIKRCEYVPRPAYCRGDNYIHKKIALNSLIAEKLLALEFEKLNYLTTESQRSIISGQKEQAMRHLMLKRFGYEQVKIDTNQIIYLAKISKRKYELRFVTLNKRHKQTIERLSKNTKLDDLMLILDDDIEINKKTVLRNDNMIKEVEEILFFETQKIKTLYGPFSVDSETILCFEINGWITSADVTEKQKKESWDEIVHKYTEKFATEYYSGYVTKLMSGKTINNNPEVFELFSKKLERIYLIEKNKKEAVIETRMWERKEEIEFASFDDIRKMKTRVILTHDKKHYKVSDLLDIIQKHPLVFRNKKITPKMFTNELKYAIADLFRDIHITEKAYELDFNMDINVINTEKKWGDYIKATVLRNKLGYNSTSKHRPAKPLTMKLDSLQNHYSSIIKIDTDKFEKINLSTVDMSVTYSNQPYAKLEPDFPILTDDHRLDYGERVVFND